eukprot:5852428-Alexandrium_andersonii.AAC.1
MSGCATAPWMTNPYRSSLRTRLAAAGASTTFTASWYPLTLWGGCLVAMVDADGSALASMANGLAPHAPGARICALALAPLHQGEPMTQTWCVAAAIRKWGDRGVREAKE